MSTIPEKICDGCGLVINDGDPCFHAEAVLDPNGHLMHDIDLHPLRVCWLTWLSKIGVTIS